MAITVHMSDPGNLGIKKVAKFGSGKCPEFKPTREFEEKLKEREELHDKIKSDIRKYLEDQGFVCNEEYELSQTINGAVLKGRADLLCSRGNSYVIIEVKSSYINRGKAMDLYQAYIYGYLYSKSNNVWPMVIVTYRLGSLGGGAGYVDINGIRLPSKYFYVKLDPTSEWLRLEEVISEFKGRTYIVSNDCDVCDNNACPLKKVLQRQST